MRPTKRCFARGRWGRRRRGQAMFDIAMPLFETDDVEGHSLRRRRAGRPQAAAGASVERALTDLSPNPESAQV